MQTQSEGVRTLRKLTMFCAAPEQGLQELWDRGNYLTVEEDKVVMTQGEFASQAMLVVTGKFVAVVGQGKEEKQVGAIMPGEIVGETALFSEEGYRSATVKAAQHSSYLMLDASSLDSAVNNPAVILLEINMLSTMARRIRSTNNAIQSICQGAGPIPSSAPSRNPRIDRATRKRYRSAVREKPRSKGITQRLRAYFAGE